MYTYIYAHIYMYIYMYIYIFDTKTGILPFFVQAPGSSTTLWTRTLCERGLWREPCYVTWLPARSDVGCIQAFSQHRMALAFRANSDIHTARVYPCKGSYTEAHIYVFTYTYVFIHTYTHTYILTYIHIHTYIHTHTYIHIHIHISENRHTHRNCRCRQRQLHLPKAK